MRGLVLSRPLVASDLVQLSRRNMRQVVRFATGHCGPRLHLHRIGLYNDAPTCRKFDLHKDSAEHLLFDSNGLKQEKSASFGELGKRLRLPKVRLVRQIQRFYARISWVCSGK